jgi:AsmA protein
VEQLKLAEGTISATAKIDASKPVAVLDYQASITGVEARKLLKTFADNDRLSGKAAFQAKGKARGRNQKELVESLNGDGKFKFLDGAIHGINLAATLRKAKTLGVGASAGETQKTDFAELSGSFTIKNGLLENRDFKMLAPLVRLSGKGIVPLPPQQVDYLVTAKLVASVKGQGGSDERLKNMPTDLRESAKGFGVELPALGIPGSELLKGLFQPKQQPAEQTKEQEAPAAPEPSPEPLPDPLKSLKGLFGG